MSRKAFLIALLFLFVVGCSSSGGGEEVAQGPLPQVFVFPGPQEERLISQEVIDLPNCTGNAESSQEVTRSHTVLYTLELGREITVSADGRAGIPGIGEVGVGAAVAASYQVGYGRSETVSRSQRVAAAPASHMQHTIQQFEIWETGELLIVAGENNQRLPYTFRRDFSIKAVAPANIGCPGGVSNPSPSETPSSETNATATSSISSFCASIPAGSVVNLKSINTVSGAISRAEELSGYRQNDYKVGETIPADVLIATDLRSANLNQFPVIPINNQGGWGLFLTTSAFAAPNDGTYWCLDR